MGNGEEGRKLVLWASVRLVLEAHRVWVHVNSGLLLQRQPLASPKPIDGDKLPGKDYFCHHEIDTYQRLVGGDDGVP